MEKGKNTFFILSVQNMQNRKQMINKLLNSRKLYLGSDIFRNMALSLFVLLMWIKLL